MESYPVRFRDPVHGFIHLSRRELKLVESRAFSRLRNIKQLALTYLVYPGAMHTRFEHSLGVMELASRAFDALQGEQKSKDLLNGVLKKINMTVGDAKSLLRVTALLHDIGHLPFSHGGEDVLPKKGNGQPTKHGEVSIAAIRRGEISELLGREFHSGIVGQIALLLIAVGTERSFGGHGPEVSARYLLRMIGGKQTFTVDGKESNRPPCPRETGIGVGAEWSDLPTMVGNNLKLAIQQFDDVNLPGWGSVKVFRFAGTAEDKVGEIRYCTDYGFGLHSETAIPVAVRGEVWTDAALNILRITQELQAPPSKG